MPMAESSAAIVVGISATRRATRSATLIRALQIGGDRRDRRNDDEKDQRQDGEEHGEGDLIRRLLAFGAFDEVDDTVEEASRLASAETRT
jgi:hypothetical protein